MDIAGDKTLNWFFKEWVYGSDMPKYAFEYSLTPGANGQFVMTGHLTQSEVSSDFRMIVPIYMEFPGKPLARVGHVAILGNNTSTFTLNLPAKPQRVEVNALHDVLASDTTNKQIQ